uniref:dUTP diphosphatase n=1 Tax=viral metagenome TaxID=1070528 RepID=A0A6C0KED1_9ZZZZ
MSILFEINSLEYDGARLPTKGSSCAAGLDIYAAGPDVIIPAGCRGCIPTGLRVSLPKGSYGRIAPRSGLAFKHGIDVGAGVIDEDYTGYIGVILFNHGKDEFKVTREMRIAQMIVTPYVNCTNIVEGIISEDIVFESRRGAGGFGSTGI